MYEPVRVAIACEQREKLNSLINQKSLPVKIDLKDTSSLDTLLLSQRQIASIEEARALGRRKYKTIRMSRKQIEKNRSYQGGYLSLLDDNKEKEHAPGIAASSIAYEDGFYLIKQGHCLKVYPVQHDGLYLKTTHPLSLHERYADGLYWKDGQVIKNGKDIIMAENGPFQNFPVLRLLL